MPSIEFRQQLYPLRTGENLIGPGEQATLRLPDLPAGCVLGISVENLGAYAWSSGENSDIAINGQRLSKEPVPLFSGDQISIQDSTLVFPLVFIDDAGEPTERVMARAGTRQAPAAVAGGLAFTAIPHSRALTSRVGSSGTKAPRYSAWSADSPCPWPSLLPRGITPTSASAPQDPCPSCAPFPNWSRRSTSGYSFTTVFIRSRSLAGAGALPQSSCRSTVAKLASDTEKRRFDATGSLVFEETRKRSPRFDGTVRPNRSAARSVS